MADRFGPTSVGPSHVCGSTNPDSICHLNEISTSCVAVNTTIHGEFHDETQLLQCGSRLRSSNPQDNRFKNSQYIRDLFSSCWNVYAYPQTHSKSLRCKRINRVATQAITRAYALLTGHRRVYGSTTRSFAKAVLRNAPDILSLDDRVCTTTQALNHLKNFIGGSSVSFLNPNIFGGKSVPAVSLGGV